VDSVRRRQKRRRSSNCFGRIQVYVNKPAAWFTQDATYVDLFPWGEWAAQESRGAGMPELASTLAGEM
jgi:hypothetical protein